MGRRKCVCCIAFSCIQRKEKKEKKEKEKEKKEMYLSPELTITVSPASHKLHTKKY
jgi:hypothetical protein